MESPETKFRILGAAAAMQHGCDDALDLVAKDLEVMKSEPSFRNLTNAIRWWYTPQEPSSLLALERLIDMRSDAEGFDDAIASSLARVKSKTVLPMMAKLLDSRDSTAPLRAATYFATFALFADKDGNFSKDQMIGPWHTEATKAMAPGRDSSKTTADYASFWKAWWTQNREKLGMY